MARFGMAVLARDPEGGGDAPSFGLRTANLNDRLLRHPISTAPFQFRDGVDLFNDP
jgi:hypothetical protein